MTTPDITPTTTSQATTRALNHALLQALTHSTTTITALADRVDQVERERDQALTGLNGIMAELHTARQEAGQAKATIAKSAARTEELASEIRALKELSQHDAAQFRTLTHELARLHATEADFPSVLTPPTLQPAISTNPEYVPDSEYETTGGPDLALAGQLKRANPVGWEAIAREARKAIQDEADDRKQYTVVTRAPRLAPQEWTYSWSPAQRDTAEAVLKRLQATEILYKVDIKEERR